jgi:D-alanyl-D-alanine carboxypeptidase
LAYAPEKARPAFVSGVQKSADAAMERKSRKVAAVVDGSTSRAATHDGRKEISGASTTPSALKRSGSVEAKADARRPSKPGWMIQIGATEDAGKANELLERARTQLRGFPANAKAFTEKVQKGKDTLYRARFAGLEEQSAETACKALKRSGFSCFATKN